MPKMEEDLITIELFLPRKAAFDFEAEFAEWLQENHPEWNADPSPVGLQITITAGV